MSTRELWYQQVAYEERMSLFYQAADVVVCRAGANTVAELTVVGAPAVVVPLPGAPGDHQVANAAVLERAGAAVVVEDSACTPERLVVELDRLVVDPRLMDGMRRAAAELGRPDALSAVVAVVEAQARARREGIRMFTKARRRPRDAQTGRAR
jgi:UDP-N-acetylglucosamine--N-acetylmuramyl-(pentapeptide) pyrophosphoryl-undecaprenol N-acetylglucosamine transferase